MSESIKRYNGFIMLALGAILVVVLASFLREANPTLGGSPGSVAASNSSTTSFTISSTAVRIAATSSCAARIISPNTSASVNLTFNDTQGSRPTATAGHMLSATTTPQAFGAENFGCGAVWAIRNTANDAPITITETW